MTVVAWDGTTLAADKQAAQAGCVYPVTKVFRIDDDRMAGIAGNLSRGVEIIEWLRANGAAEAFPKGSGDDEWVTCLVVHRSGTAQRYESRGTPFPIGETRHAIGSGRDFATAAMHLGCSAEDAVKVAMCYSADCGIGIDALVFAPSTAPRDDRRDHDRHPPRVV